MPELRKDPLHERWVIVSLERGRRPSELSSPRRVDPCPFCPGNEHLTPPEIAADREPGSLPNEPGWHVRVFPSKFPALCIEGDLRWRKRDLFDQMEGVGAHEVIVETPHHDLRTSEMPEEQLQRVIRMYRHRVADLYRDPRLQYVLVFKNCGPQAGASLQHPHSQVIATPVVPHEVQEELDSSRRYYQFTGRCLYCDLIEREVERGERLVYRDEHFVAVTAFAARFPFETWIFPRAHRACFAQISEEEVAGLAHVLRTVWERLDWIADRPPYNYLIHTAPRERDCMLERSFHWHLELIPRITRTAGFEWGTGFFINPISPEEAAGLLRGDGGRASR